MTTKNLENVCKFIQRMDRNSDIMEAYKEFQEDELPQEVLTDICIRVLNEWYHEGLTDADTKERKEIQMYLDLL
jgi:hypothetical protein